MLTYISIVTYTKYVDTKLQLYCKLNLEVLRKYNYVSMKLQNMRYISSVILLYD